MGSVGVFLQARKLIFCQMACIYQINNRGLVKTFNFDITLLSEFPSTTESRADLSEPGQRLANLWRVRLHCGISFESVSLEFVGFVLQYKLI